MQRIPVSRTRSAEAYTRLVLEIFRLNGRLLAFGDAIAAPFGLSSARWQVLGALRDGPITVSAVARRMGLKRQSVQRVADALAAGGWLAYRDNPDHRRAMLAGLTARGTSALEAVTRAWDRHAKVMAPLFGLEALQQAQAVLQRARVQIESPDGKARKCATY